ncbi:hypothetical protein LTR84_006254 [Exophiala bonariae]|uniref:Peptidase A1 domain-containing protein n=1 Tax=Exophiala bonariae TaxID=1690606 RepID=A0AAV9N1Z0_9EURO|nr:hypothetical protein LTR84_006254 [Exophiala bonariae]
MEFGSVQISTADRARIYGPNETTFNERSVLDLPPQIRSYCQSGRATTPRNGSPIYAPQETKNVSALYLDDQAFAYATNIEFFVGPVVHSPFTDRLQMIQIKGIGSLNFSMNACVVGSLDYGCQPQWHANVSELDSRKSLQMITIPTWLNETGSSDDSTGYTIIAAADGYYDGSFTFRSPYIINSNHDNATFDHILRSRPHEEVTTSIFEIFLWQQHFYEDEVMIGLINGTIEGPVEVVQYPGQYYAGIGIHCDVTSSVGYADLDPARLTYSSFALANERSSSEFVGPLTPFNQDCLGCFSRQTWVALHDVIGSLPIPRDPEYSTWRSYHSLTPKDLQLAMCKLLGESVITMMDEGGINPSYGELRSLRSATYLVAGAVSWIYVLTLLCLWACIMCAGAAWMLFFAGRRWAKTLDGLEMFKFGAQLADEVSEFKSLELKGPNNALKNVPGMVGILPGGSSRGATEDLGFIGLSENRVSQKLHYTLDR